MKFDTASDYAPGLAVEARRMCLHVATILGDLLDEIVVVGGLVPYLLVEQDAATEAHVGTRDLDRTAQHPRGSQRGQDGCCGGTGSATRSVRAIFSA